MPMNDDDQLRMSESGHDQQEQYMYEPRVVERRSTHKRFTYSTDRIKRADARSLDRVWDRLEEHVTRNSAAYFDNNNLATFRTDDFSFEREAHRRTRPVRKRQRLEMLAAACILALLVGGMAFILHTAHQTTTGSGGSHHGEKMGNPSKKSQKSVPPIVILYGSDGLTLKASPNMEIPAGDTLLWLNQTKDVQTIVSDNDSRLNITLDPGGSTKIQLSSPGKYSWHLQSNFNVHVIVVVQPFMGRFVAPFALN